MATSSGPGQTEVGGVRRFGAAGGCAPPCTADQVAISIVIAVVFWVVASGVVMLREGVVPYRPGQYVSHDIVSRVGFVMQDPKRLTDARDEAWNRQPMVFTAGPDIFAPLEERLLSLPARAAE